MRTYITPDNIFGHQLKSIDFLNRTAYCLFGLLMLFCFCASSHAQDPSIADLGTYQLLTTQPKLKEVFTSELLIRIESERHDTITRIVKVGLVTWARILSREAIEAPDFAALSDDILEVDPDIIESMPQ